MSEFSFSNTLKKTEFSTLLLSNFFHICFFILSHPLYLFYFIFFSPYLLKFLSFLSPLCITTLLLLLVLLTISPPSDLPESKFGFLVTTYQYVLNILHPKVDVDDHEISQHFEELDVYKIVFDTSTFEITEDPVEVKEICSSQPAEIISTEQIMEVKRLECLFEEENELEKTMSFSKEEKEVNPPEAESHKEKTESKVMEIDSPNLGSFGSMRKEKEWRRTLACKLFEERHNVDGGGGGEGMDMLWETYETESNKDQRKGKKSNDDDDDDEDDEDGMDEQLCCLQALKFSAGKMNLGMGRPNLVKISKTLKGFGWLHHLSRHGKKGSYH